MEEEEKEQGEDLGARNKSRDWYQSGASPERPRGAAGMEKLRPGTSREQKPSRSRAAATTIIDRRYHHRLDIDSPLSRINMES